MSMSFKRLFINANNGIQFISPNQKDILLIKLPNRLSVILCILIAFPLKNSGITYKYTIQKNVTSKRAITIKHKLK